MKVGDRIPHVDISQNLDSGHDVTDLTGPKFLTGSHIRPELPEFQNFMRRTRLHEVNLLTFSDRAFLDSDVGHHTSVMVIFAVKDKRP